MIINDNVYRSLIENQPQIVLIMDSDFGHILHANKSASDFYGYSLEEFKNMKISDISTCSEEEVIDQINAVKKNNQHQFIFKHKLKNGSYKKVYVHAHKIAIENKEIMLSVINEMDSTLSRYNQEFVSMIEKMDDAVCMIKISENEGVEIIRTSHIFDKLISGDNIESEQKSFYDVVTIAKGYTLKDIILEGFLKNSVENKWLPVRINSIKLRFEGEVFFLLTFKSEVFHANNNGVLKFDNLMAQKVRFIGEGYLINVSLFININQKDRYKKAQDKIATHVEELFESHNLTAEFVLVDGNIIIFSNHNLSDLYASLNTLLEKRKECDTQKQFECKIRISISNYDQFCLEQVNGLNEVIESFVPYEYNSIHTYSNKEQYARTLEVKTGIDKAILNDEFELYAQGIVDISNNRLEGYEILIRWNHPKYGIVMPDEFIPYTEMSGKIIDIDFWVINATFKFLRLNMDKLNDLIIHINLSAHTLSNRDFIPYIHDKMDGIIPSNIVFEITEDQATGIMDSAISELKKLGFLLAIDDFGKGYSSFERIKNIGVQYVKIDKSFITGLTENIDDLLILKAIIGMCNNLNIKVIAEGIEKIEQLEFLYSRKCYYIQGYIFSKPKSVDLIIEGHQKLNENVDKTVTKLLSNEIASKKFYNHGRIIMQDINESYRFITPNIALAEALGYEFSDFIGLSMLDIIPIQYVKTFKQFIVSLKSNLDFDAIMVQLLNKDKEPSKVICAVSKTGNDNNSRLYIEFLDQIKEHEFELLGLSHSYLQAFDEAPSGMIIVDDNFSIKKWNISCENIFNISSVGAKNKNVIKLLADNEQSKNMNRLFNKAMNHGNIELVIENRKRNGETITCRWHINAIYDELEASHQYICIVNDITESIKKSRELTKVNKALDQSKSIIMMTDINGIIEYTNKKFYDVTGYTTEEALGVKTSILSSGENSDLYYSNLWETILKGEVWEGEFHNKRKGGGYYWARTTIYPIVEEGEISGFVGIQTDITNEKDLLSLNQNLKNKLFEQDKVASLGLLSSGIMHEINNPLSYIQGNIKYVIDQFDDIRNMCDDDLFDLKDAILDIDIGVTQIREIAEGLKKYIFKGEVDEKESVDLVEEINTILMLAKNEYKYHANVSFVYLEDTSYKVLGYASKLKQVFMNLIINAAHAISSMNKSSLGNIVIELVSSDTGVLIAISDDGCGMDLDTIEKIYEPLFTTKEEGVGSGLGLSVSRKIIEEDHGGVIICESSIGKGTTFKIKLKRGL